MAKNKAKKQSKARAKRSNKAELSSSKYFRFSLIAILAITFLVYFPTLQNDFVNWDDLIYVVNNPVTQSISGENLQKMFSQPIVSGDNYLPFTWLSFAIDYQLGGGKPFMFHLTNLLLHLLCTFLVFRFAYRISNQNWFIAAIVALLFGIHPMHVESVAWIAERKDVLYGAFFLGGLLTYLNYLEQKTNKWLLLTALLFIASLLSKPAAVVFPLVLLLIDFYQKRDLKSPKMWIEKIPFFFFSLILGWITIQIQSEQAISEGGAYSMIQRLSFGAYGLMMYVVKLFLPINLSAIYPFPVHAPEQALPLIYKIAPVISLLILGAVYFLSRFSKMILFGFAFFLINIILVLQLLPVGSAVMADRYTYLSYIGFFLLLAYGLNALYQHPKWKNAALGIIGIGTIAFAILTFQRGQIWKDSPTLWTDAIKKQPDNALAYFKRGEANYSKQRVNQALNDYNQAIKNKPGFYKAYTNRGYVYFKQKKYDAALKDYNRSLELNPNFYMAYNNRGHLYYEQKDFEKALVDYDKSISINPDYYMAYNNRAIIYHQQGEFDKALENYNKALALKPDYQSALSNRAVLMKAMGK